MTAPRAFGDASTAFRSLVMSFSAAAVFVAALFSGLAPASAEDFVDSFETPVRSWVLTPDAPRHLLIEHRRQQTDVHDGRQAEFLQFDSPGLMKPFGMVHDVPKTPVFNELTASIWVKSNQPGARLWLRIQCPNAIDPESGHTVVFGLSGDTYTATGQWQQLKCVTSDEAIRERQTRLRAELIEAGARADIDLSQMYIDKVEIRVGLQPGATGVLVDNLEFGPLVSMNLPDAAATAGPSIYERLPGPLDLSGGHARLHGHPWVCRMVPYHGEPTDLLRKLHFNVVWLDRNTQSELTDAMQAAELWVSMAPPLDFPIACAKPSETWSAPRTANSIAQASATANAGSEIDSPILSNDQSNVPVASAPVTIGSGTEAVLFWNLGARIPATELQRVEMAVQSIRQSDRLYEFPRPVVGDVISHDRRFSRQLDVTGSSVPMLHSNLSPRNYFATLRSRSLATLAGSPKSTWVSTEPSPAIRAAMSHSGGTAVVEPEQIMMQVDLALAAGYQAVNYWTRTSLADQLPGNEERRAAIELANRQIQLLEPWIATGEFVDVIPVTLVDRASRREYQAPILATISQSELGILLKLVWIGDDDQFVPGPMAAGRLKVVVRGAGEMPVAYGITTTGTYAIEPRQVAGGTELTIENFDQSASIIITGFRHQALIERLNKRIVATKKEAASTWVRLAAAKHERVMDTHYRIQAISLRPLKTASVMVSEAGVRVDRARDSLAAEDFDQARQEAKFALDLLRRIQRSNWEAAVQQIGKPHADLNALCFESLPTFWAEQRRIASSDVSPVQLTGGTFEDGSVMRAEGWQNASVDDRTLQGQIDLAVCSEETGKSVRLAAGDVDGADPSAVRAVLVTPEVTTAPGSLVKLQFRLRGYEGRKPGILRVYDQALGPVVAMTTTAKLSRWEDLSLVRPVGTDGRIRFQFELLGSGIVCIDDVTISAYVPEPDVIAAEVEADITDEVIEKRRSPLRVPKPIDLLPTIPKLPSFPSWKWDREPAEAPTDDDFESGEPIEPGPEGEPTETPLMLPTIRPGHGV